MRFFCQQNFNLSEGSVRRYGTLFATAIPFRPSDESVLWWTGGGWEAFGFAPAFAWLQRGEQDKPYPGTRTRSERSCKLNSTGQLPTSSPSSSTGTD